MSENQKHIQIWQTGPLEGYKLIDSGDKQKIEEIGGVKIVRAEPRAWWGWERESSKQLVVSSQKEQSKKDYLLEKVIDVGVGGIKAKIKFKPSSKHIGIFPEQISEWKWIFDKLESTKAQVKGGKEINVLNLFGYTGIASLVAAKAGLSREGLPKWRAKITHVDASKPSVDWAKENQKLSGLEDAPIRWIIDDVVKFLKREIKRGERYDAIIMDPPSYGKGPKGEVWKIEEQLPELLSACREILSDQPLFIIFNMYSTDLSAISLSNLLSGVTEGLRGQIELGELAIEEQGSERLLPMSIFALWYAN